MYIAEVPMSADYATSSEEQEEDQQQISPYQRRQQKADEAWKEIRKELLHGAVVSIPIPSNAICVICHKEAATVLCKQCGNNGYFCETCAINLHSSINILHAPVMQKVCLYIAVLVLWIIHKSYLHGSVVLLFFDAIYNRYKLHTYLTLQDTKQFPMKLPTAIAKLNHNCGSSCYSYRTITCVGLCGKELLFGRNTILVYKCTPL